MLFFPKDPALFFPDGKSAEDDSPVFFGNFSCSPEVSTVPPLPLSATQMVN